jgi:hypothetical protein
MAGRLELLLDGNRKQRPNETEFVAVGVNQMEKALTPFGIVGRGSWLSGCERSVDYRPHQHQRRSVGWVMRFR